MARLLHSLRRVLGLVSGSTSTTVRTRSIDTDFSIFREGDRVVLHTKQPQLSKPLVRGGKINLRRGHLEHDRIIGSRVWDAVQAHRGSEVRLSLPTLEEYVALTPRHVTPIYSHDANLIVSLLDLHANPPAAGETQPPTEILESGTGHGSLTLHLARAIHAANTTSPPQPSQSQIRYVEDRLRRPGEEDSENPPSETTVDSTQREWDTWRAQRNAVIHSVDVSSKFSALAEKNVRGFRRGIYTGDVDFYVGPVENWIAEQSKFSALAEKNVRGFRRGIYTGDVDFYVGPVENWIAEQTKQRTKTGLLSSLPGQPAIKPFLSHVILDMPSAHLRIPHVAPILRRDGILVVFVPSITQVGDCVKLIRQHRLPFVQERVAELGIGISSGRLWDVRVVAKKSGADPSSWSASAETEDAVPATDSDEPAETVEEAPSLSAEPSKEDDMVMVCRPKVGLRTMGGGFLGVWRRIEDPPVR